MFTLENKGRDPREEFHLQHIVRVPDANSFVAVALHARTGSPIDATLSRLQTIGGLLGFYWHNPSDALWYVEQLNEHDFIEPRSMEGTPLCVLPNELVQFGFKQEDVCRIIEQGHGGGEQLI